MCKEELEKSKASQFRRMNRDLSKGYAPPARVVEVDSQDIPALKDWAERLCRGWTVQGLASFFGIEATEDAIANYLSEGLEGHARDAVVDACRRELARTGEAKPSRGR